MNKNIGKNMAIAAMSAFVIQLIFKLMGNSNKSVIIRVIIFIVQLKKSGNKLSIVGAILLLAAGSTLSADT
ncbi:hypothetical protein LF65_04902 [Clostridium beijerinckii]|uniref:Uncharacterized protein n=1 Tax=Clostridium beijerinckii TaxID=1520 RepID=A0A0B5QKH3_CLOBE|nr:hypothetical protein [Clostridium beijerinckii]AJH01431.1 hypothetical protein LF65_04902 [Clostridium beijerinckii]